MNDAQPSDADRLVAAKRAEEDAAELALRPQTLDDFIGQKQVRENLKIFIAAAKRAARRSTTCCSMGRPASARPRSPRSWRARWASASARPRAR